MFERREFSVKTYFYTMLLAVHFLVFRDTSPTFRFWFSLFHRIPERVKIFLICIGRVLLVRFAWELGYVFMDELGQAVLQFYPSTSGGLQEGGGVVHPRLLARLGIGKS